MQSTAVMPPKCFEIARNSTEGAVPAFSMILTLPTSRNCAASTSTIETAMIKRGRGVDFGTDCAAAQARPDFQRQRVVTPGKKETDHYFVK